MVCLLIAAKKEESLLPEVSWFQLLWWGCWSVETHLLCLNERCPSLRNPLMLPGVWSLQLNGPCLHETPAAANGAPTPLCAEVWSISQPPFAFPPPLRRGCPLQRHGRNTATGLGLQWVLNAIHPVICASRWCGWPAICWSCLSKRPSVWCFYPPSWLEQPSAWLAMFSRSLQPLKERLPGVWPPASMLAGAELHSF